MTDKEILLAVLRRIEGRYDAFWLTGVDGTTTPFEISDAYMQCKLYYTVLFDTRFAKAAWGEDDVYVLLEYDDTGTNCWLSYVTAEDLQLGDYDDRGIDIMPAWQHHQQELLKRIQRGENPFKYLEEEFLQKS